MARTTKKTSRGTRRRSEEEKPREARAASPRGQEEGRPKPVGPPPSTSAKNAPKLKAMYEPPCEADDEGVSYSTVMAGPRGW